MMQYTAIVGGLWTYCKRNVAGGNNSTKPSEQEKVELVYCFIEMRITVFLAVILQVTGKDYSLKKYV